MRRAAGFIVGIWATAFASVVPVVAQAGASARLVYLRGPGAEQCPGEQAVRAAVSSRLGYDPFFAWAPDTLFAEITRERGAFRTQVKLVDGNNLQRGARDLSVRGADCSALIDAIGLTISLTIDPVSVMGATSPAPAGTSSPAVDAGTPVPQPSPDAPSAAAHGAPPSAVAAADSSSLGPSTSLVPPPSAGHSVGPEPSTVSLLRPSSTHLGLGALVSIRSAPSTTVGASGFVGASWHSLSVDLELRADLPAGGAADAPSPARVSSWIAVASVVPCWHLGPFFGCPVLSGGVLTATARDIAQPKVDRAEWWAAGGRLGAEWAPLFRVSFRGYAEVLDTLTRNKLAVDGTSVYAFAPWSADFRSGRRLALSLTSSDARAQEPIMETVHVADLPAGEADKHARFRWVFEREFDYVWTSLRRLGVAMRDLEDVAQEVFVRVHRRIGDYDASRPIRPWLFAFAVRCASDWRRLARHRVEVLGMDAEPACSEPGADDVLSRGQDVELVLRALESVEIDRRAVFILFELDGCPMKDIADTFGIPLATAYSRLRLARGEFTDAVRRLRPQRGAT